MVFKSMKTDLVIHFAIYIEHNKILHVEGRDSCIEVCPIIGENVYILSIGIMKWYNSYTDFPYKHLGNDTETGLTVSISVD